MIAVRTTYRRPDAASATYWGIDDDAEYAAAPQTPGPALDTAQPEVSLLLAMLERAILDLGGRDCEGGYDRPRALFYACDAFEWIANAEESVWSFTWVCDHLLLDVSATRQRVFVLATRMRRPSRPSTPRGTWHAA